MRRAQVRWPVLFSDMFGTIRKHQNWLWIVIIFVIIITFVVFFSPNVEFGRGPGRAKGEFGTIGGRPISAEELYEAEKEARLRHFMSTGGREWPENDEASRRALEQQAVYRIFLKQKARELGIRVSDETVGRMLRDRLGTLPLATFEQEYLHPQRMTLDDLERFLRTEASLLQMVNVAAATAKLLNPQEAEILFRKENQEALTEVALFSVSNYLAEVKVSQPDVAKFFTNRMAMYRIPEKLQVSYVAFPASNFLAEAEKDLAGITNLEAQVEEIYYKRGTNTFKGTNDTILSAEEAKKKLKDDFRHELALREARRKASEFGQALMDQAQTESTASLEKLAQDKGLTAQVTPPFDRMTGLETNFPPEFTQRALSLTTNAPVSFKPIVGQDAVYLIALKNRIPSEMPVFEKVQEKVTDDYKRQQALELARKAATNFYATATNTVQQKKSLSEVGAALNVNVITPPPFSPSTTTLTNLHPQLNLRMLQQFAFDMKAGEMSGIVPSAEGAMIVYLRELKPVDEAKVKTELPDFLGRLRVYRQNEAFNNWFRKQAEQARVVVPQRETQSTIPGAAGSPGGS